MYIYSYLFIFFITVVLTVVGVSGTQRNPDLNYDLDPEDLAKLIQPMLDEYSNMFNVSYQYSVHRTNFTLDLVAGFKNREDHVKLDVDTIFPVGSTTKAITAVGIMQLYE